jgi:G3E family GTPase
LSLAEYISSRFAAAARDSVSGGTAVAIIENEIGDVGIDNLIVESTGYKVRSLFSGCICCTLVSDLTLCVNDLAEKYKPSYIIIEATGLAYPDNIVETIRKYSPACTGIISIVLVDAERWEENREALDLMVSRQLRDADIVLLNKTDTVTDEVKDAILTELAATNPASRLFAVSARNDSLSAIWETVIDSAIRKGDNNDA